MVVARPIHLTGILLPLVAIAVGCTALPTSRSIDEIPLAPETAQTTSPQIPSAAPISVEIRKAGKAPQTTQLPFQAGMHLQDALLQSQATKRFRRMNLHVMRSNGQGMAKLDSKYDFKNNRVDPLYDYALHSGDRVIVTEDTRNALDDLLEQISIPVGPMMGR